MTIEEIARGLTEAQRRVLLALPLGEFVRWIPYSRHGSVRKALSKSGCTEPKREGAVTLWFYVRVTPLGEQVRTHLQSRQP